MKTLLTLFVLFFSSSVVANHDTIPDYCYYVDGVKLRSTLANLPARSYGSIQVYTGGIPAKYGDTTGGVVAIETQGYFSLWRQEKNRRDIARKKASRN